jgi:hypothetical protein
MQGSVEEPAAKDFVARKVHTIKLTKVQGTIWNAVKCKEHLRSCPEAVIRQATINLYSQVWKSLGDSFPKLYCVDLAEACVMQESVSLKIYVKKRYDLQSPNGHLHEKPLAKGGMGIECRYKILNKVTTIILLREKCIMCARNMGAHVRRGTQRTKGMRKRDEKLDSRAAEKGAKKLLSSNYAKILDKECSN